MKRCIYSLTRSIVVVLPNIAYGYKVELIERKA